GGERCRRPIPLDTTFFSATRRADLVRQPSHLYQRMPKRKIVKARKKCWTQKSTRKAWSDQRSNVTTPTSLFTRIRKTPKAGVGALPSLRHQHFASRRL